MYLLLCILYKSFLFLYLYIESIYCERNVWVGCDSDVNMCYVWWLDDVLRIVDRVYKVLLM